MTGEDVAVDTELETSLKSGGMQISILIPNTVSFLPFEIRGHSSMPVYPAAFACGHLTVAKGGGAAVRSHT